MLRAIEYTCGLMLLSTCAIGLMPSADAGRSRDVPLAYVRRLAMPKVAVTVRRVEVGEANKKTATEATEPLGALCTKAADMLDRSLRDGLSRLGGCSIMSEAPLATWSEPDGHRERASVTPPPALGRVAGSSDATLAVSIDRFGMRSGFFREVWLRVVAYVIVEETGEIRGPVHALGLGRSAPRLVRPGFMRTDEEVLGEAVADAASRLMRALDRGERPIFAADVRVAVIPARTPEHAERRDADGVVSQRIAVPALRRQADVFFQPDVGPVALVLPAAGVRDAMRSENCSVEDLWDGLGLRVDRALEVGSRMDVDYVFLTAIRSAWVGRFTAEDGSESVGDVAEVVATASLVDVRHGTVLWKAQRSGSARSHIVVPDGMRRTRSDEQCVMDAAVAAFAATRVALEEWMRRRKN